MKRYRQHGFTLIEVTVVMAIAALLAVGVLFNQSQFRQRAAFTSSMEVLKNRLKQIQQETIASVNSTGAGNSNQRIFGTLVEFDTTTPTSIKVTQLLGDDVNLSNGSPFSLPLVLGASTSFTLESGSSFTTGVLGGKQAIIFTRSPDYVYAAPASYNSFASVADGLSVLNPNNYSRGNLTFNPAADQVFNINSAYTGLTGNITVNTNSGTITRTVN